MTTYGSYGAARKAITPLWPIFYRVEGIVFFGLRRGWWHFTERERRHHNGRLRFTVTGIGGTPRWRDLLRLRVGSSR